jgi:hypothetical protein
MKLSIQKVALLLLVKIFLTPAFAWDAPVDATLTGDIASRYRRFCGDQRALIERDTSICPAVHFVTALGTQLLTLQREDYSEANDLRRVLRAVLLYGTGVGGISTRQANEAEVQGMVNTIFWVTASDVSSPELRSAQTPHQQAVRGLVIQSKVLVSICQSPPSAYRTFIDSPDFKQRLTPQEGLDPRLIQALTAIDGKYYRFIENYIGGADP